MNNFPKTVIACCVTKRQQDSQKVKRDTEERKDSKNVKCLGNDLRQLTLEMIVTTRKRN